jgi:toxin FitB
MLFVSTSGNTLPNSVFVDAVDQSRFAKELRDLPISGGAIYDGLVGLVARSAGLPLLSRDRRASVTHPGLGIVVEFLD